jgi:hypothetical protein
MRVHRLPISVALVLVVGGCADQAGSFSVPVFDTVIGDSPTHILQQSPTAPPLSAYETTFWAKKGKESRIPVDYVPVDGQKVGQPFLYFNIPKEGLIAGPAGTVLAKNDSVLMTLTIDPVSFSADLQPSGVKFSVTSPASLTICYENMNQDLNGDGVVDGTDELLQQQISFWYQSEKGDSWWVKLPSKYDGTNPCVSTPLYHFSYYAVSW